jgi:hypothetical protein
MYCRIYLVKLEYEKFNLHPVVGTWNTFTVLCAFSNCMEFECLCKRPRRDMYVIVLNLTNLKWTLKSKVRYFKHWWENQSWYSNTFMICYSWAHRYFNPCLKIKDQLLWLITLYRLPRWSKIGYSMIQTSKSRILGVMPLFLQTYFVLNSSSMEVSVHQLLISQLCRQVETT